MRNFHDTFETRQGSFTCAISISTIVHLTFVSVDLLYQTTGLSLYVKKVI